MDDGEYRTVMAAMLRARREFNEFLEDKDMDPSYFKLKLTVRVLDLNFEDMGEELTWTA